MEKINTGSKEDLVLALGILETELRKAQKLQYAHDGIEGKLWLHLLGYADWYVEIQLIKEEIMKIGLCVNFTCRYKNESETALCNRDDCPLMTEKSPFEDKKWTKPKPDQLDVP